MEMILKIRGAQQGLPPHPPNTHVITYMYSQYTFVTVPTHKILLYQQPFQISIGLISKSVYSLERQKPTSEAREE
jgi:hypothetical protein